MLAARLKAVAVVAVVEGVVGAGMPAVAVAVVDFVAGLAGVEEVPEVGLVFASWVAGLVGGKVGFAMRRQVGQVGIKVLVEEGGGCTFVERVLVVGGRAGRRSFVSVGGMIVLCCRRNKSWRSPRLIH